MLVEADAIPDGSAYHRGPERTVLPAPVRRLVVRVSPDPGGGAFAEGTSVTLRLQTEVPRGRGVEPDEVIIDPVDVSGLTSRELAVLDPDGSSSSLLTPYGGMVIDESADHLPVSHSVYSPRCARSNRRRRSGGRGSD